MSHALLVLLTLACLLPFSGRAFHVDDTLFVWAARQISRHPLDPYGFSVNWYKTSKPMADEAKNPPLAAYYLATAGRVTGLWSERAFHIAFLVPALALVLGTYRLAGHFTRFPLLAASAALLTPAVIVSACSVMCDTMMVALWVWAVILWVEGLEPQRIPYLVGSAVLIAASILTKYFAVSLILLLPAYSWARVRGWKSWVWCLLIPVGVLGGYEIWTHAQYGHALFSSANEFARVHRHGGPSYRLRAIIGLSFTGGCALTVLTFAPLLWSRTTAAILTAAGALAACVPILGWGSGWLHYWAWTREVPVFDAIRMQWELVGVQLALFIAGGLFTMSLALADYRKRRSPDSLLLGLWVLGTVFFTSFVNWTINARSVLPLIPAAAILIARRLETRLEATNDKWTGTMSCQVVGALAVAGFVSVWLATADTHLANVEREAAYSAHRVANPPPGTQWFQGHWGFQYYMEQLGALPVDDHDFKVRPGDTVVVQDNGMPLGNLPPALFSPEETLLQFPGPRLATTMGWQLGAGFYDSYFGPLPYSFGRIPPERYRLLQANLPH